MQLELDGMLIIHFQERIDWMNIIYADYNFYHNSKNVNTSDLQKRLIIN